MKKLRFISIIFVIAVFVIVVVFYHNKNKQENTIEKNKNNLINEIKKVKKNDTLIQLQDITPFEWDTVYHFGAFTNKEICDKIIGKSFHIEYSAHSENTTGSILFVNKDKPVCYIDDDDYGVYLSLLSVGAHKENAVSFRKSDLGTLYINNDAEIRMFTPNEYNYYSSQSFNIKYSYGTAYYLYDRNQIDTKKIQVPPMIE